MAVRKQKAFAGKECPYCGELMVVGKSYHRKFPTKDHVNPRALGGGPSIIVCRECNQEKGCTSLEDWLRFLMSERPTRVPAVMAQLDRIRFGLFIPKDSELRRVLRAAKEFAGEER